MPEPTDTSVLGTIALWGGLGVVLAWLGLQMNLLEERVRPSRCASCRRRIQRGSLCSCIDR